MSSSCLRAFELQPAVERLAGAEQGAKVECLELCADALFVGTTDGRLIQYQLDEVRQEAGDGDAPRTHFRSKPLRGHTFGTKSPVTFVRSASALNRLLVLCDGALSVLSLTDLAVLPSSGSSKLKGVSACCINENPYNDDPFSVQICLGKKKQVAVINITEDRLTVDKICDLSDLVCQVSMDGVFVCAALATHYVICNVRQGTSQELFPFESAPVITRVAKEEFLLSAPGDLGMFVTSAGMSERPPIQWSKEVNKFVLCTPYIIALSTDGIVVYSILDQQQKQTLHFSGGRAIGNFDGRLLVASSSSIYCVKPIPVETQIQSLLDSGLVEEALDLAENAQLRGRDSKAHFQTVLNHVRQKAGFVCLKKMELQRAKELFIKGKVDPRELISLYPRLLPASSHFVRSVPALHDLADVNSVTKADSDKADKLDKFLEDMLQSVKATEGEDFRHKFEVDTALLKLYAKTEPLKLLSHVQQPGLLQVDSSDCEKCLEQHSRHHALATLQQRQGQHGQALALWAAMAAGKIKDDTFPGMDFFRRALISSPEEFVWRYADFVLEKDEVKGVEIFMRREHEDNVERDEKVINFLQKYPKPHLKYLEHLVVENNSEVEKFHTQLASTYLDLIQSTSASEKVADADADANADADRKWRVELRTRFQSLIVSSSLVKTNFLLSRLDKTDMHQEKAILYGKMGDHDKALRILVCKLEDFQAAENYCDQISKNKPAKFKQNVLHSLLKIYLDPNQEKDQADKVFLPALDLLNRRAGEMHPVDVVNVLPESWSVATVLPALTKAIKGSSHQSRMSAIERGLESSDNVTAKYQHYLLSKEPIKMGENSYCMLCKKQFLQPVFTRFPNGVLVHPDCVKDPGVCPITGQVFRADKGL